MFQAYFDLFVMFLIVKNTSENSQSDQKFKDKSTGQNVPSIVFLKNQQYLKDVLKTEYAHREEKRQQAVL